MTNRHYRVIFPVGHGGFSFECIDNVNVVYDCGSDTAPTRVEQFIDCLNLHGIDHIDYLFISHFDNDHVNQVEYLVNHIHVRRAIVPQVPQQYRIVYNAATHGAYMAYMNVLGGRTDIVEVAEKYICQTSGELWEWITMSMLTQANLQKLQSELNNKHVSLAQLEDPEYIAEKRKDINAATSTAFPNGGPNAYGLIMLSQKIPPKIKAGELYRGCHHCFCSPGDMIYSSNEALTACLYVGDADLKVNARANVVKAFWKSHRREEKLLLMQIPHHGSQHNRKPTLDTDFPSEYYFVQDNTDDRIKKGGNLYNKLNQANQLLMVCDDCRQMIVGITHL